MMLYGFRQSLAQFKKFIDAPSNFSLVAPINSFNCAGLVALAMGAATVGRAINHASATCAGVARTALAT